jgi:hypothetical protein
VFRAFPKAGEASSGNWSNGKKGEMFAKNGRSWTPKSVPTGETVQKLTES